MVLKQKISKEESCFVVHLLDAAINLRGTVIHGIRNNGITRRYDSNVTIIIA